MQTRRTGYVTYEGPRRDQVLPLLAVACESNMLGWDQVTGKGKQDKRKGELTRMTTVFSTKGIPSSKPCTSKGKTASAENERDSHPQTY